MSDASFSTVARWQNLIFGTYSMKKVLLAVNNTRWQHIRAAMQGTNLASRHLVLSAYVHAKDIDDTERTLRKIRVTNYVHALKRGGMIK